MSSTYDYATSTPSVLTGLDITSASPALKTTLTLTGTGMDTDSSLIKATLLNVDSNGPSYPMSIVSVTAT